MSICVSGSLAFDTIMQFDGRFADHILPEKVHMLNVSFIVPGMKREFGGCAGNIAYALRLLGADARPLATVGADGSPYLERLKTLGIDARGVKVLHETYTAQCFITTDHANNQITAFHPGAMSLAHRAQVADTTDHAKPLTFGIVAPNSKEAMQAHASGLAKLGVPFVFDPGQGLPQFSAGELLAILEQAAYLAVNDYEGHVVEQRVGQTMAQLSKRCRGVFVTKGEHGVEVWQDGTSEAVGALPATSVVDPTGCGDAFRGGLLVGLDGGKSLIESAQMGCVMGSRKIATAGGQNYTISLQELEQIRAKHYG
jgi:adenosine kinase